MESQSKEVTSITFTDLNEILIFLETPIWIYVLTK